MKYLVKIALVCIPFLFACKSTQNLNKLNSKQNEAYEFNRTFNTLEPQEEFKNEDLIEKLEYKRIEVEHSCYSDLPEKTKAKSSRFKFNRTFNSKTENKDLYQESINPKLTLQDENRIIDEEKQMKRIKLWTAISFITSFLLPPLGIILCVIFIIKFAVRRKNDLSISERHREMLKKNIIVLMVSLLIAILLTLLIIYIYLMSLKLLSNFI